MAVCGSALRVHGYVMPFTANRLSVRSAMRTDHREEAEGNTRE